MLDNITRFFVKMRRLSVVRVFQRTLVMLMPLALVGSYFKLLRDAVFSPDGFIYNIFDFDDVLPDRVWYAGNFICGGMVRVTFGLFGLYVAYYAARYTARLYHKDSTMAGTASTVVMLFCAFGNSMGNATGDRSPFDSSLLRINGLLLGLFIGYGVGQIFHWLGKNYQPIGFEHTGRIQARAWHAIVPTIVAILGGIILGASIYELQIRMLNSGTFKSLVTQIQGSNNLLEIVPLLLPVMLLSWLGIGYPLTALSNSTNSAAATANLNFALKHSIWHVPYKFLGSSLVSTYATMGGTSIALALSVIILLKHQHQEAENIAKTNLLPVVFNSTWGFAVGMPLIFNPIFVLPILIIPIVNVLLAAGAIALRIIPPCVYPILRGTPGILLAFFGSNGNWSNLFFSIFLFGLDILMLIPVTIFGEKIEQGLKKYERKDESNVKKS